MLWLAAGSKKLSRATIKAIDVAPAVYVSTISGFEISLKVRNGKLELSCPVTNWFKQVVEHHGLTVLSQDVDVCITAADLQVIHDDPFDRFSIAAAKLQDLTVATADEHFEQYGLTVIC